MYRAQLERYAASSAWCGLNPGLNPGLLSHFLPTYTGSRDISRTVTSGEAGNINNNQQSGNAEAPPTISSLGLEGLNTKLRRDVLLEHWDLTGTSHYQMGLHVIFLTLTLELHLTLFIAF